MRPIEIYDRLYFLPSPPPFRATHAHFKIFLAGDMAQLARAGAFQIIIALSGFQKIVYQNDRASVHVAAATRFIY